MPPDLGRFACGTRAVVREGPHQFRVVCSTCDGPCAPSDFSVKLQAHLRAIEDSAEPCPWCGAGSAPERAD